MTKRWTPTESDALAALLEKFPLTEIVAKANKLPRRPPGRPMYRPEYAATIWLTIELLRRVGRDTPLKVRSVAKQVAASLVDEWKTPVGLTTLLRLYSEHEAYLNTDPQIRACAEMSVKNTLTFAATRAGWQALAAGNIAPLDPCQWSSTSPPSHRK